MSDGGKFRNFADEASWVFDHTRNLIKGNLSRASKERITRIKPREKNGDDENCSVFKRKVLSEWTDPPDLQVSKLTEVSLAASSMQAGCHKLHQGYKLHREM